jgi:hypothetical protein
LIKQEIFVRNWSVNRNSGKRFGSDLLFFTVYKTADEKLGFADEAGLDSLLALLDHEHPKIRSLAEEIIGALESDGKFLA